MPRSTSESSQTRSSSARPTTSTRIPSSMTSLAVTTSPLISDWRAITTLKLSLSTTSAPRSRSSWSISGCNATRIFRPLVSTSTVSSSFLPTTTPYAEGGWDNLSTSPTQGRNVLARFAQRVRQLFVLTHCLSHCPLVSSKRSSSERTRLGPSARRPRRCAISSFIVATCAARSASRPSVSAITRMYTAKPRQH